MIKVELDKNLFDRFSRNLEKEANAMIGEIGLTVQNSIRTEIAKNKLQDTGNYMRSIQLDIKKQGTGLLAVVGTNSLYALPLEYGLSKKFYPSKDMIEAVSLWAKRKLGLNDLEAKKAGASISWNIARKGADLGFPRRFGKEGARSFETGFMKASHRVPSIIERFIRRAAAMTEPLS